VPPKKAKADTNGEPMIASTKRDRHWGWTIYPEKWDHTSIFNPRGKADWEAYAKFLKDGVDGNVLKYFVFSTETCPESNRLHYQGYCQFDQPLSMKQVKEVLNCNFVHLWLPKGSAAQNRKYARKGLDDADPTYAGFTCEYGTMGYDQQGARTDLSEFAADIKEHGVSAAAFRTPAMYLKYGSNAHKLEALYTAETVQAGAVGNVHKVCTWIWGNPGLGKSWWWRWLLEGMDYYYLDEPTSKTGAQWWDGYKGQRILVIDDMQGYVPAKLLLELADPYAKDIMKPVKGSYTRVYFDRIIITSNMEINVAYKDSPHAIAAIKRRFTEFHMTKHWKPPADQNIAAMLKSMAAKANTPPAHYLEWQAHQHRDIVARDKVLSDEREKEERQELDWEQQVPQPMTVTTTLPSIPRRDLQGSAASVTAPTFHLPTASQMATFPSGTLIGSQHPKVGWDGLTTRGPAPPQLPSALLAWRGPDYDPSTGHAEDAQQYEQLGTAQVGVPPFRHRKPDRI